MKFSMLTLLIATGYAGLVFAAFREPETWLRYASFVAWLMVFAYVIMLATDAHSRANVVFGRVCTACVATYLVLTWLPVSVFMAQFGNHDVMPHRNLAAWLTREPYTPQQLYLPASSPAASSGLRSSPLVGATYGIPEKPFRIVEAIAALNFALIFGLLAGSAAYWRFCRNEKIAAAAYEL